ncbi:MAG: DUF2807 domain-containing protein [Polaribacter sp.]|uniref:GIN domain-containing protein n=1 Tax=Polaribacter sp. TaxID=1920175 RepID=UPI003BB06B88
MKKLIIIALLINASIVAQVKGNKNIESRTFSVENLEDIKINLYAKIIIDYTAEEKMTIITDSNLFDKIDTEIVDGKLNLNQLEWIESSQKVIIKIGAPNLKRIETGTHETLQIVNVNSESLNIMAIVGKVVVSGKVDQLNIGAEIGEIDASNLIAENARVNIWGRGKVIINVENEVDSILKNDGKLVLTNEPLILKGDTKKAVTDSKNEWNSNIAWINFKIKNNSWNRNQFFVIGPKKDGSKFSYGFPMMPGYTRKENWSVGTKVYKVNSLGLRELLVEIKQEDKDKTLKLFE